MRITKKWIRTQKSSLSRRLAQVALMSDRAISAEYVRMFSTEERTTFDVGEMRKQIIAQTVEAAFPSHICD